MQMSRILKHGRRWQLCYNKRVGTMQRTVAVPCVHMHGGGGGGGGERGWIGVEQASDFADSA